DAGCSPEGAMPPERSGAAGHSMGGYTVEAPAICPLPGAFTDTRIKAVLPIESAVIHFPDAPGIFATISIPMLLLGGRTTPLAPLVQGCFDATTPGAKVLGLASLDGALHGSFTDDCEIPAELLRLVPPVGPKADCEPESLPWRTVRHVANYLALNFFDATLNENPEALARLGPAALAAIDDTA